MRLDIGGVSGDDNLSFEAVAHHNPTFMLMLLQRFDHEGASISLEMAGKKYYGEDVYKQLVNYNGHLEAHYV